MKLKISKLSSKPINTKNGPTNRVSFQCNGEWFSAFQNKYTDAWQNGMEIDVEVQKNGQYNNIVFPKETRSGSTVSHDISKDLADIKDQLRAITSLLRGESGISEPPPHTDEDYPL